MVSEVLSKMIRRVEGEHITGFMIDSDSFRISHLQFADDTMIFCDAEERQLGFLRYILCCFEAVSDLKINLANSELFQVGGVPNIEDLA